MKTKQASQYGNFDRMMRDLVKIPHGEIKAKLDVEKAAKKQKRKKLKKA